MPFDMMAGMQQQQQQPMQGQAPFMPQQPGGFPGAPSFDQQIRNMVGSMAGQAAPRNPQIGSTMPGGIQSGGKNPFQMPDGSFNTAPLEILMERMRGQNKIKSIKAKEQQQLKKLMAGSGAPGGGFAVSGS